MENKKDEFKDIFVVKLPTFIMEGGKRYESPFPIKKLELPMEVDNSLCIPWKNLIESK